MDSAVRPASDEEEAQRRRSTDCIYFLASPLTCKKGSECEYRHSDAARVNPRDCWYWFNGNCMNPKCSFRHLPLDGLLGGPATPRAAQQPAPQVSVPAQAPGSVPPSGTAKQGVPCYYFQKGMCLKGDRCAFLHVPQAVGNPAPHQTTKDFAPALQPHLQAKNSWIKPNSSAQQNTSPSTVDKPKFDSHNGKPAQKRSLTSGVDHSLGVYHNYNITNHSYVKKYQPPSSVEHDLAENGMEVGEFVREPSAGSGVLIGSADDDAEQALREDSSYHRTNGEQQTGMLRPTHGIYELEPSHRSSSERLLSERSFSQREHTHASANSSDLRHRLLKQRRLTSSRLTGVPDGHDEYCEEERRDHRRWRDEEQATHENLSCSRLHGRIKLPGVMSLDGLGSCSEKERERGPRVVLSPPKQTDLRGKLHDRLRARSNEDIPGNTKGIREKPNSGEEAGFLNFAGPKSLAELKAKKVADSLGEHANKNASSSAGPLRMTSQIVATWEPSEPVPFEGPKPLSVILKRKREAVCENAAHSGSIQEEHIVREKKPQNKFGNLEQYADGMNAEGKGEEAFDPEDDVVYDGGLSPVDDNASGAVGAANKELEEHQDIEQAEECEYEAADDNAEDNDYQEYEDDDLDDDDFARKVGVMFS